MWVSSKCTATHFSSDSSQTNDPKMENSTWYFPLHSLGEGCCHSQHLYYDPFSAWPIPRRLKHLNRWMKLMLLLKNKQKQKNITLVIAVFTGWLSYREGCESSVVDKQLNPDQLLLRVKCCGSDHVLHLHRFWTFNFCEIRWKLQAAYS